MEWMGNLFIYKLLEWFRSFLTDRHQCVQINGSVSSWVRAKSGVPQRCILGPLLFALYRIKLPSLVSSPLLMFADDIKLYLIIRSPDDCLQQQHDRDVLAQWSKRWLLSFNAIKCIRFCTSAIQVFTAATSTRYKKMHSIF